jgi:folate-binding protein YgfZ
VSAAAGALAAGAGLAALPGQATSEVAGSAARDFLHRLLSQDLRGLASGETRRACLLDVRGRVLLDALVWGLPDGMWLSADARAAATGLPALERYVLSDDVRFAATTPPVEHAWLAGPRAEGVLAAAGAPVPERGRWLPWAVGGAEARVLRRDLGDRPGFRVAVPASAREAAERALLAAGASRAAEAEFALARVETGTPWWGSELDDRVMPTEAGLDDAVSFSKGCYLGQEPVTMSRHRGHPPSLLCRFALDGSVPASGGALLAEGRPAGRLTTVAGGKALGYALHARAKAGTAFDVEGSRARASIEAVLAR